MINEAEAVNRQAHGDPAGVRPRSIYELLGPQPGPWSLQPLFDLLSPAAYVRNRIAELERQVLTLIGERDAAIRDATEFRRLHAYALHRINAAPLWVRIGPWLRRKGYR